MSIIQSFQEYIEDVAPALTPLVKERTTDMWLASFDEFAAWIEETLEAEEQLNAAQAAELQRHTQAYLSLYEGDPEEEAQRLHVLHETAGRGETVGPVEQTFVYYDERPVGTALERSVVPRVFVHCLWRGVDGRTTHFSSTVQRLHGSEARRAYTALLWRLSHWLVRNQVPRGVVQSVEQLK